MSFFGAESGQKTIRPEKNAQHVSRVLLFVLKLPAFVFNGNLYCR